MWVGRVDGDSVTYSRCNIMALELNVRAGATSVVSLCQFTPRLNISPARPKWIEHLSRIDSSTRESPISASRTGTACWKVIPKVLSNKTYLSPEVVGGPCCGRLSPSVIVRVGGEEYSKDIDGFLDARRVILPLWGKEGKSFRENETVTGGKCAGFANSNLVLSESVLSGSSYVVSMVAVKG